MSDFPSFETQVRQPRPSWWRRACRALAIEARMVAACLRTPVAMGLESILRFVPRPGGTVRIGRPEQFPDIAALSEEYGAIAHAEEKEALPPRPFSIGSVPSKSSSIRVETASSKRRILKIFHAARHTGA